MSLRFVLTKGITMCKLAIVKEWEKNAKKLIVKNLLYELKYHAVLQNSKILHAQSKVQGEIFKLAKCCNKRIILKSSKQRWIFYPNWQGPNSSWITPNFWLKLFPNSWKSKLLVFKNGKLNFFSVSLLKGIFVIVKV